MTRSVVLRALAWGPLNLSELTRRLEMPFVKASKVVTGLEDAGEVEEYTEGRSRLFRLAGAS